MFKKILGLTVVSLLLSVQCFAMIFSQPVKTGFGIKWLQAGGGMMVENASANDGDYYKRTRNGKTIIYDGSGKNGSARYGKGIARFGNGNEALYAHYDAYNIKHDQTIHFGGKDIKNTIPISSFIFAEEIYKISTNEGITFYMFHTRYDLPDESWWTLIGRRNDGSWVKYFDSDSVTEKYFGKSARAGHAGVWSGQSICCDNFRVNGNMIAIEYSRYYKGSEPRGNFIKEGEFLFTWDDAAQWFSIEHVVY